MPQNPGHGHQLRTRLRRPPDVYANWGALLASVRDRMDLRRYELVTFAAAQRLRSSYCSLAHGSILSDRFGEDVRTLAGDRAGLSEVDVAVMELAEQVVDDATADPGERPSTAPRPGLTDGEIMDVILTAALRAFWTKTLDARRTARRELRRPRARDPRGARRRPADRRDLTAPTGTLPYEVVIGDPAAAVSSASDCRRFAIIESISKIALAANSAVICPGPSYWGATSTTS